MQSSSSRPIFCPVRDCTLPGLASNEICLRWVVFVAEALVASMNKTDPERGKMALAARRVSNYRHMRQMIASSDSWSRTSTIFGLAMAATTEFRSGDSAVAAKHLGIAYELLKRKEGLRMIQTMRFAEGMIVLHALVSIKLPLFTRRHEVEDAVDRWQRSMMMMSEKKAWVILPKDLRGYLSIRVYGQWRTQIAIMHMLNCILTNSNADEGETYLVSLDRVIRGSQGSAVLSPLAILAMLCSCAAEMGWWSLHKDTALRSWETVELLALMELAPKLQATIVVFRTSRTIEGRVPDFDIEAARNEIFSAWELRSNHS